MALDAAALALCAKELSAALADARIDKIFEPTRDESVSYTHLDVYKRQAFDCGITHIDMANNYGPVPGAAEENFGSIFEKDLRP